MHAHPASIARHRSEGRAAWLVALAWAGLAGGCGGGEEPSRPRNVILISLDTLRPDHLSCYGNPNATSPTLDGLAARGARFTDVTAGAPWTLPSHATMLTGLYPSHHGVKSHQTRLGEEIVTVAEELRAAGFTTLGVVNTHNIGAPQYRLGQGFERFEYITENEEDPRTLRLRTPNVGRLVVASGQEMLAKRDASRPFFLFLHFYDAHTDFTPDESWREAFVEPYDGKLDGRTQQLNGVRNRGDTLAEPDLRFLRQMYDAEIRTLDDVLAGFLGWLAEQDLLEDTLIVVTSDHGEEFQEHGSVLHGRTQYQELLEVPLILAGPGVPAGRVIDVPVHGIDVTPTVLGCLGIASSMPRDGLDLSVLWKGGSLPERALFAEADQDNRRVDLVDTKSMVRRGSWKLIQDRRNGRVELYDLEHDPHEVDDRSAEHPDLVRTLGTQLQGFRAGAVPIQAIAPPTPEEQRKLDAMGYGGGQDEH